MRLLYPYSLWREPLLSRATTERQTTSFTHTYGQLPTQQTPQPTSGAAEASEAIVLPTTPPSCAVRAQLGGVVVPHPGARPGKGA